MSKYSKGERIMKFSLRNDYLNIGIDSKGAEIYRLMFREKELLYKDGERRSEKVSDNQDLLDGCQFFVSFIDPVSREVIDCTCDRDWVVLDMSNRSIFMDSVSFNSGKKDFFIRSRYKIKSNILELKLYLDNQGEEDLLVRAELLINLKKSKQTEIGHVAVNRIISEDGRAYYQLPAIKGEFASVDIKTIHMPEVVLEDLGASTKLSLVAGLSEDRKAEKKEIEISPLEKDGYILLRAGQELQAKSIISFN